MGIQPDPLSDLIMQREVVSEFRKSDGQRFLPAGSLNDLISKDAILWELEDEEAADGQAGLDDLADFIDTKARNLFAITIRHLGLSGNDLRRAMQRFKDNGFDDAKLPLKPVGPPPGDYKRHILATFNTGLRKPIWSVSKIEDFCASQWKVLAPVFEVANEKQYHQDFERGCILPFIESHTVGSDKGSFGQVYKYKVHPDHVRDPEKCLTNEYVAVKEIQPRSQEDRQKMIKGWENEAQILQKMNSLQQKHIVRFLTAFRHGDRGNEDHYLMFEWADGGNLRNLWKTDKPLSARLVKETIAQLHGLAAALDKAHYPETGPTFRHGDLKPENILWFKDNDEIGTLKIADWGLAKQQNVVTELRRNRTSTEFGTRRYESPEEETGDGVSVDSNALLTPGQPTNPKGKRRSRLYDMWAMGCITLEFLVWLLYGPHGLRSFNDAIRTAYWQYPPFYEIVEEHGKVKAEVHHVAVQWMEHMAKDPRFQAGETALGKLLEFVQTRLLCVKLPTRLATANNSFSDLGSASSRRASITFQSSALSEVAGQSSPSPKTPRPILVISNANRPDPSHTSADEAIHSSPPIPDDDISRRSPISLGVTIPIPLPITEGGLERARADEFFRHMDEIILPDVDDDHYWLPQSSELPTFPPGFTPVPPSEDSGWGQNTRNSAGRYSSKPSA